MPIKIMKLTMEVSSYSPAKTSWKSSNLWVVLYMLLLDASLFYNIYSIKLFFLWLRDTLLQ